MRIIPLLLHRSGFYSERRDLPAIHQELGFFERKKEHSFHQQDSYSCGPYALFTIEGILKNWAELKSAEKHMRGPYREKLVYTMYRFSTDSDTLVHGFYDEMD